ncbi:GH92 family glycosyl hydrolase [Persicobacter diffluens]|uniref:Alpha-1 2-mannosidase n=1 Tax=Persicobacter diffluens TaxID=981 RepID=A0AAN4VZE1_9BACT|nr:alpha-1 2-mannosidase [Persicobacter diffluens]
MSFKHFFLLASIALMSCKTTEETTIAAVDYTQYVNTFTGTDGPGNTYPGATVPHGMIQLSPDNGYGGWDRIAGYFWPDSTIAGFSHTHLSGTGAGDLYDILVMPLNDKSDRHLVEGPVQREVSLFSHDQEAASPGYYEVELLDYGIKAEMTATERVGVHRYQMPAAEGSKIKLDLGYALNWDAPTATQIKVIDNETVVGYRYSSGWAAVQKEHFVMKFSEPFSSYELYDYQKAYDKKTSGNNTAVKVDGNEVNSKFTKAYFHFAGKEAKEIMVKVALSSVDIEGAMNNMSAECPGFDFDAIRATAKSKWNEELGKIAIETPIQKDKEVFYTAMYQSHLAPTIHSDVDGRAKGADQEIHQAKGYTRYDTFSLWDTFRAAHPLYTMIDPDRAVDMVKSLMAYYEEIGELPVWSMKGNETYMMIAYHAVPVITDAYFKGLLNDMDAEKLFEACKAAAMMDNREIDTYKELGYVPHSDGHENWSVSKTMEYAYDDWCVAQLAKALNKQEDYEMFMKRAANWENVYHDGLTWILPKDKKGNWVGEKGFDAKNYSDDYCESNAWHYVFFVPQDIEGLIYKMGEPQFEAKLDSNFNYFPAPEDDLPIFSTGMIGQYAHGNEPSHHVAYLYNYVGKPWKTQERVREILATQYRAEPDGVCGNEDCGQMSAWYIYSALGFYPVNPATGDYDIGSPKFDKATIKVKDGKTFTVVAHNNNEKNIYIQKVSLNGKPLEKAFINHADITKGGELVFEMGPEPNTSLTF